MLGNERFKMCLFEPVHQERLNMGWVEQTERHSWLMGPPQSAAQRNELERVVCEADVAVLGDVPIDLREKRAATGRLTFIMSERMWRVPYHPIRMLNPRFARGIRRYKAVANRDHVYHLSMGAYAAGDVRRINAYAERIRCWGYFAEMSDNAPAVRMAKPLRLLWAGRLLSLKRVDVLIKAFALLDSAEDEIVLDIIGSGPEKKKLERLAQSFNLAGRCVFHDPVNAQEVRARMQGADIYVFPSNRHEGWGVVANEAMIEGAVLVANEQAGASRVLIDDNKTGFLFKDGDVNGLAALLRRLIASPQLCEEVRQNAWQKMHSLWHPRVGAERLLHVSQALLAGQAVPVYEDGPFSLRCTL